jgi:hypothetical protein
MQAAAMAPAEAPETFFKYKSGAYLKTNDKRLKHDLSVTINSLQLFLKCVLSKTRSHPDMIDAHESTTGERQIHLHFFFKKRPKSSNSNSKIINTRIANS